VVTGLSPTKKRLLETAERLFAAKGVNAVSLRQIRIAAGQRNESTLHYHFGSREGLLRAILNQHVPGINARRDELAKVLNAASEVGPQEVVETYVLPYAELLDCGRSPRYYLQMRANLFTNPEMSIPELHRLEGNTALRPDRRMTALSRMAFPHIPHGLLRARLEIAQLQAMQALAFRAMAMNSRKSMKDLPSTSVYIANLIDMYCGAVGQPLSDTLRAEVEKGTWARPTRDMRVPSR